MSYPVAVKPAPKEIVEVQQKTVVNDAVNFEERICSTADGMFSVTLSNQRIRNNLISI